MILIIINNYLPESKLNDSSKFKNTEMWLAKQEKLKFRFSLSKSTNLER